MFPSVLGVEKQRIKIMECNLIGPVGNGKRLIVTNFQEQDSLGTILSKTKILKGTHYTVSRDFCKETRIIRGRMLSLGKQILVYDSSVRVSLSVDRLFVNGKRFEWDEEEGLLHNGASGVKVLSEITKRDMQDVVSTMWALGGRKVTPRLATR